MRLGLPHYFSGVPCLHGHISKRPVSTRHCSMCDREREYDLNHNKKYKIKLLQRIKSRAKIKKMDFNLTTDDIDLSGTCPSCNADFTERVYGFAGGSSPTVDRVDNTKGYVKENVAIICHDCNMAKSALTANGAREKAERLMMVADFIDAHNEKTISFSAKFPDKNKTYP